MKQATRLAQGYADRHAVSSIFSKGLLHLFRILVVVLLSAAPSADLCAGTRDSALVEPLLQIEADHTSLCQARQDPVAVRGQIDELVSAARTRHNASGTPTDHSSRAQASVATLNGIVFGHAAIRPSQDLHDPCNVFISSVLARKQGYCVGIAALYLVLAEHLNLPIVAVSTPSHVFLRYDDGVTRINIETMNAGAAISDEQYIAQQRIAEYSVRKGVFLRALSAKQFLAQVHNNLGVIYSERKAYEAAEAEYARALDLDRHLPAAWYNSGKQYMELGQLDDAIRHFTKALRLHPNDTWALNNRGLAYRDLKDTQKARSDFEAVLRIDPAFEQARSNLAALQATAVGRTE